MWFSPGADAIITTVLGKGCLCLLLSSPYSPATLQCPASLLLLKVIRAGGKLDLWLGVTLCGSCDATGLVAASAQWHWHCCSLVACTRAPELPWLAQLSPQCHPRLCWHRGWVCLCFPSLVCSGDRSHPELCFPASSGSSCSVDPACSSHRAAGKPSPCCCNRL